MLMPARIISPAKLVRLIARPMTSSSIFLVIPRKRKPLSRALKREREGTHGEAVGRVRVEQGRCLNFPHPPSLRDGSPSPASKRGRGKTRRVQKSTAAPGDPARPLPRGLEKGLAQRE